MRVLWTPRARRELHAAIDFIALDKPGAALRVANRIYEEVSTLARTPHIGRVGLVPDTRELIFHPWPYIG